jgi:hypothetical protein
MTVYLRDLELRLYRRLEQRGLLCLRQQARQLRDKHNKLILHESKAPIKRERVYLSQDISNPSVTQNKLLEFPLSTCLLILYQSSLILISAPLLGRIGTPIHPPPSTDWLNITQPVCVVHTLIHIFQERKLLP